MRVRGGPVEEPYRSPSLRIHGSLEELTQHMDGAGDRDAPWGHTPVS